MTDMCCIVGRDTADVEGQRTVFGNLERRFVPTQCVEELHNAVLCGMDYPYYTRDACKTYPLPLVAHAQKLIAAVVFYTDAKRRRRAYWNRH